MKANPLALDTFVMLYHEELDRVLHHAERRDLKPGDTLTFLAIVRHMNWRSGKAEITSEQIGKLTGTDPKLVRTALARLKKFRLVAYMREGTTYFYSLHPSLMRPAREDCRNLTVMRWKEAGLL